MASHCCLKKRIALFGEKAEKAITEEVKANHNVSTYKPLGVSKLTDILCICPKAGEKEGALSKRIFSTRSCTKWHPSHYKGAPKVEEYAPQEKKDNGP